MPETNVNVPGINDVDPIIDQEPDAPPVSAPNTPHPAESTSRPRPEIAKRGDFIEGGNPREAIKLKPEARQAVIDKLLNRASVAKRLRDEQKPLSVVDQMVLQEGFLDSLQSGNISAEDVALGWYVISDEIMSTAIATSHALRVEPGRFKRLGSVPLIGRLARDPRVSTTDWRVPGTGESISEYATKLGMQDWSEAKIEKTLRDLTNLKIQIEKSFYKNGVRNPLIDKISGRMRGTLFHEPVWGETDDPLSIFASRKTGNVLKDEMIDQADAIVKKGIDTGEYAYPVGTTIEQITIQHPVRGLEILHEASQRALSQMAKERSLEIVSSGKHETDTTAIRQRATEMRQPPNPEEATPLEEANTKAQTELTEAQAKYDHLKTSLESAIEDVRTRGAAKNKAEAKYKAMVMDGAQNGTLVLEIDNLRNQLNSLYARLGQQQPQQQQRQRAQQGARVGRGNNRTPDRNTESALATAIKDLQDRIAAKENQRNEITNAKIDAEVDLTSAENHLDRLRGTRVPGPQPTYAGGEIDAAERALFDARARATDAKNSLEAKRREIAAGGTPERAQKAKALEREALMGENRARIQEELFAQEHGTEFTTDKLSDSSITSDGQVAGVEAFRKLMIQTIDKTGFDPEMMDISRSMVSNEFFARAIIEHFGVSENVFRVVNGVPVTLGQAVQNIELAKRQYSLETDEARKQVIARDISTLQTDLTSNMIHWISNLSRGEIASFVNFMIDDMLVQAELGNPYPTMVK